MWSNSSADLTRFFDRWTERKYLAFLVFGIVMLESTVLAGALVFIPESQRAIVHFLAWSVDMTARYGVDLDSNYCSAPIFERESFVVRHCFPSVT